MALRIDITGLPAERLREAEFLWRSSRADFLVPARCLFELDQSRPVISMQLVAMLRSDETRLCPSTELCLGVVVAWSTRVADTGMLEL